MVGRRKEIARTIAAAAMATVCSLAAASGAVGSEPFGPTVSLTNDLSIAPHLSVDVDGFTVDHRPIFHRFRGRGPFEFEGKQLMGMDVTRFENFGNHTQTIVWSVEFLGTAEHYDLKVGQLVMHQHAALPAGVRVLREVSRCWDKGRGSYPCRY